MRPVVTAAEMRALDRATIEAIGIPAIALMETAGRACAAAAVRMLVGGSGHVAVVCGPGNNGGDGFVIARVLRERGVDAVAYLAAPRTAIGGDAAAHLAILEKSGGVVRSIARPDELAEHKAAIAGAALAVDALFGVGLARPIAGHLADVIAAIAAAPACLAVDLPSGLATDTGHALGACVRADRTVTMAALKIALVSAPGFASCGEVEVAEIGIPAALIAASSIGASLVERADVVRWLPRATPLDHKGTRGHVIVIGGSPGMRGAGRLAALAALRAGAGLATLAASELDGGADAAVMTHAIAGELAPLLAGKRAIVIGCGLADDAATRGWVAEVLRAGIPAVIDAGALAMVTCEALAGAAGPIAITPHPGEAARLLGTTVAALEADRLAAARQLAQRTGAVVAYKGARTIVCDGTLGDRHSAPAFGGAARSGNAGPCDPHASIIGAGGPALATAGTGDVLAGTIGGLLAQGLSAHDAVRAAAFVHGIAGESFTGRAMIASDLPSAIGRTLADYSGAIPRLP